MQQRGSGGLACPQRPPASPASCSPTTSGRRADGSQRQPLSDGPARNHLRYARFKSHCAPLGSSSRYRWTASHPSGRRTSRCGRGLSTERPILQIRRSSRTRRSYLACLRRMYPDTSGALAPAWCDSPLRRMLIARRNGKGQSQKHPLAPSARRGMTRTSQHLALERTVRTGILLSVLPRAMPPGASRVFASEPTGRAGLAIHDMSWACSAVAVVAWLSFHRRTPCLRLHTMMAQLDRYRFRGSSNTCWSRLC